MHIEIKSIPHSEHRYDTCGDYWKKPSGKIELRVSKFKRDNEDYEFLIAMHELVELYLTQRRGIDWNRIDAFDIAYEVTRSHGDFSEPGNAKNCPYRKEHQLATKIEKMLAKELKVNWKKYDDAVNKL